MTQDQQAQANDEKIAAPTPEEVAAAQQAQMQLAFNAKYPLSVASWFEPGKGIHIGIAPRGAQGIEHMISKITFDDLAVAEHDIDSVLRHIRQSIQGVIHHNGFEAGRQSALAEMQAKAEQSKDTSEVVNAQEVQDAGGDGQLIDVNDVPDSDFVEESHPPVDED
jgi:hypothetical protein